jgi:hypothetical protein
VTTPRFIFILFCFSAVAVIGVVGIPVAVCFFIAPLRLSSPRYDVHNVLSIIAAVP